MPFIEPTRLAIGAAAALAAAAVVQRVTARRATGMPGPSHAAHAYGAHHKDPQATYAAVEHDKTVVASTEPILPHEEGAAAGLGLPEEMGGSTDTSGTSSSGYSGGQQGRRGSTVAPYGQPTSLGPGSSQLTSSGQVKAARGGGAAYGSSGSGTGRDIDREIVSQEAAQGGYPRAGYGSSGAYEAPGQAPGDYDRYGDSRGYKGTTDEPSGFARQSGAEYQQEASARAYGTGTHAGDVDRGYGYGGQPGETTGGGPGVTGRSGAGSSSGQDRMFAPGHPMAAQPRGSSSRPDMTSMSQPVSGTSSTSVGATRGSHVLRAHEREVVVGRDDRDVVRAAAQPVPHGTITKIEAEPKSGQLDKTLGTSSW